MIVNLTYFVQIINFLIGYWLVKKFLFTPILLNIENDTFEFMQSEDKIKKLNELVLINKNKLTKNWQDFYKIKKTINFLQPKAASFNQVPEILEIEKEQQIKDKIVQILLEELDDK
jgi:hypothetical protein